MHAKAGDCFFLDCRNEYTHISSEDDPWELMWIHFYGPQCDAYYDYFLKQQTWHFHTAHLAELTAAIQSVIRFHEEPTDDTDLLTAQQIVNILTLICTETDRTGCGDLRIGQQAQTDSALSGRALHGDDLPRFSRRRVLHQQVLSCEGFKKEYGTTIIRYVLAKKTSMQRASALQQFLLIEKSARLCGMDDASYFNKVFKKMEGCTASEYRKQW